MCLAIPAKLIEVSGNSFGVVNHQGLKKEVSLELVPEAKIGDYLVIHVGYALEIIDPDEARLTLELANEIS